MKNTPEQNNGKYYLPVEFRSKMSIKYHLLYIFLIGIFTVFEFIVWNDWTVKATVLKIGDLFLILFFMYFWLGIGVLRLGKITVNQDKISISLPFKKRTFLLTNIREINIVNAGYNIDRIQIIANDIQPNRSKLKKSLQKGFGTDPNEITITDAMFNDVNFYALKALINSTIKERQYM